jgi:hypothetical protein
MVKALAAISFCGLRLLSCSGVWLELVVVVADFRVVMWWFVPSVEG